MEKVEFYKRVKIAGMLSFIPVILAAGPVSGYVAAKYLQNKFGWPFYVSFVCIGVGIIMSIREAIRVIKAVLKLSNQ